MGSLTPPPQQALSHSRCPEITPAALSARPASKQTQNSNPGLNTQPRSGPTSHPTRGPAYEALPTPSQAHRPGAS